MLTRRKFVKSLCGFVINVLAFSLSGCTKPFKPLPEKNIDKPKAVHYKAINDIEALSHKSMQGREPGTAGELKAVRYITKEMEKIGLEPAGEHGYQHTFLIPAFTKAIEEDRLVFNLNKDKDWETESINLLGALPGKSDDVIIVSAHYDHLGIFDRKAYPGANDNASGVGAVLDIMRRLSKEDTPKYTIVAAFWSAEEMGFRGSKAFIAHHIIPRRRIKAVFNLDSVGNGKTKEFVYWAEEKNPAVKALLAAADDTGANVAKATDNSHHSDEVSFEQIEVPAVTLISRQWLDKNQSLEDTLHNINAEKVRLATDIVYRAIKEIE